MRALREKVGNFSGCGQCHCHVVQVTGSEVGHY